MSKVGKRAFLLLLAIPIVINVMAQQTKKPTLEDLIPGGESYRYAENLYGLQWWGDECIKPGIDTIYSIQPQTGKETMLITREQIACRRQGRKVIPFVFRTFPMGGKAANVTEHSRKIHRI